MACVSANVINWGENDLSNQRWGIMFDLFLSKTWWRETMYNTHVEKKRENVWERYISSEETFSAARQIFTHLNYTSTHWRYILQQFANHCIKLGEIRRNWKKCGTSKTKYITENTMKSTTMFSELFTCAVKWQYKLTKVTNNDTHPPSSTTQFSYL